MMYGTMLWIVRGIIAATVIVAIILMLQVATLGSKPALIASAAVIALLIYHQVVEKKAKAEKDLLSGA